MFINASYSPNFFKAQHSPNAFEALRNTVGNLNSSPLDGSMFSSQANLFMMMSALSNMFARFNAGLAMPGQPSFGLPGRGLLGPNQCLLGPTWGPGPSQGSHPAPAKVIKPSKATPAPLQAAKGVPVKPQTQSNDYSCGQTSVAMAVNSLTGKSLTDRDIDRKYGLALLAALNSETKSAGYRWQDAGNFRKSQWPTLEKKLNQDKTPVLIGLNGPQFSSTGRGHIVTLLSVNGNSVRYADPADGKIKTTTRQAIESAPAHPDGKFVFYASR